MAATSLHEWLAQFCEWNEVFKQGALPESVREHYMAARRELCQTLLMAQRLAIEPGGAQRGALRVARALQVEFELPSGAVSAITYDISTSGLSVLVAEALPAGGTMSMRLKLGGGAPVVGRCRVVKLIPKQGSIMLAVVFESLSADANERIESVVCDVVATEIRSALRNSQRLAPVAMPVASS